LLLVVLRSYKVSTTGIPTIHFHSLISDIIPIPLNTIFLDTLSQVDLLACLALTDTSATLHSFILEEVLGTRTLCRFLRRNQYLLQHDIYGRFFTKQDLGRLRRAVEALRRREGDAFYTQVLPFLGPLIGLTPRSCP
jgi:hypothetical protein